MDVFGIGLATGLTLILAIGAQNAFVLRQGLRGEHVLAVVLTCAVSDALLIALGVTSFAQVAAILPWLETVMRFAGAAFLIWYGLKSMRSAFQSTEALVVDEQRPVVSLRTTILTCLALTWLNPHVYLDTVVLLGSISTQFPSAQAWFAAGAITGSFVFFFSLGFGAKLLRPLFANPVSWRVLEGAIAVVMWLIALKLLLPGGQG